MEEKQSENLLNEILESLDGPNGYIVTLKRIAKTYPQIDELEQILGNISDSLQLVSILLRYMRFDLEATQRERDRLRDLLSENNEENF